ncbi:MAG: SIR2 family protein [Bacillota bacterium]
MNAYDNFKSKLEVHRYTPFLFAGAGLSRRYFNLEDWVGLLRNFAVKTDEEALSYEKYKQIAVNSGDESLPNISTCIEKEFNTKWFSDKRFKQNRSQFKDMAEKGISPYKIEIAEYIKSKSQKENLIATYDKEIDLLTKIGERSITGIITTNYDCLFEHLYPHFTAYIGQEDLLFSDIMEACEIYKIHGCCNKPESIVINKKDYDNFNSKNAYLASKLLTIFLEYPIIFIGYSINDANVRQILSSIAYCIPEEKLPLLKDRLFFIEWDQDRLNPEENILSMQFNFPDLGESKIIEMNRFIVNDFEKVFEIILGNKAKYETRILRKLKSDIYGMVSTDKNTPLKLVGIINEDNIDKIDYVMGVGVLNQFGRQGLKGIKAYQLYEDIILNNGLFNIAFEEEEVLNEFIETEWFELVKHHTLLPVFKYLRKYKKEVPDYVKKKILTEYDKYICHTIRSHPVNGDIMSFVDEYGLLQASNRIPCLPKEELYKDDLGNYLRRVFDEFPEFFFDPACKKYVSSIRRLIRIYDFITYYEKAKSD